MSRRAKTKQAYAGQFPPNPTITLTTADWIMKFIRKNGRAKAIDDAWLIGVEPDVMRDFIDRNVIGQ